MTSPLLWRNAGPQDRLQLQDYVCTEPPKRKFIDGQRQHPREWELDAQSGVRTLRVPAALDKPIIVGCDDGGIAVVYQYEYDHPDAEAFINVIAVALRSQGLGYGMQALHHVLTSVAASAAQDGAAQYFVAAKIHASNERSKKLCRSKGFSCIGPADEYDLEYWTKAVSLT